MTTPAKPRLLTPPTVELLESPTSALHLASRDARLRPHTAYGYACRVEPGRERVTVGISAPAAAVLMADVRANSLIALVACNIRSFFTIQLKGNDARIESADDALRREVPAYFAGFVQECVALGFSRPGTERHIAVDPGNLLALSFTATAAFVQTPGPGAGVPMSAAT